MAGRMDLPRQSGHRGKKGAAPSSLPHFRSTAGDQVDLNQADPFSAVRMRLRNAFTPAQPIKDRQAFAGRIEILTALIRAIEETRLHIVLYGERGLGKTSILHILAQAAREARYLVIYVPCDASSNFDEVFRSVASKIPLLFHGAIGPTAPESERGQTLADILPEGPLTSRTISDGFANVVGTRVIVLLDEFDRCESRSFRHSVAELVKNLSDRSVRVQLVIAGVADDLAELIEFIPSVQRNIFALQLPRMGADEIRQLMEKGEAATGLRFAASAADQIITIANGFPYFASLLCHYAALHALDGKKINIETADVVAGLRYSLDELGGRITRRSMAEITACAEAGHLPLLGELSGVAQLSGGLIDGAQMRLFTSDPGKVARCESLVELLASKKILVEPVAGSAPVVYRFSDENVLPYLWLRASAASFDLLQPEAGGREQGARTSGSSSSRAPV